MGHDARGSERAAEIARSAFGIDAAEARPLPGDEESNWRVADAQGGAFLLRLYASGVPRRTLEFQRDLIEHAVAADPSLEPRLQRFLPLGGGSPAPGAPFLARVEVEGHELDAGLLRFLPGRLMSSVRPHAPELLADLGACLGGLDRSLVDFDGRPAAPSGDGPSWRLVDGPATIAPRLAAIEAGPLRRDLVAALCDRYRAGVEPRLDGLRESVVHQDANDNNVIVDVRPGSARVKGLIDFGDATHTITVAEPAIAAAYAALGKRDPLTAMCQLVAGYHGAFPLTPEELDVLFDLALLRLATSVAVSSERASEYHLVSQAPAWSALERLVGVHPRLAAARLRAACGLEPLARSAAFARWARGRSFEPVLGQSLAHAPRVDLSVASALLIGGERDLTFDEWGARLEALRRGAAAAATVGYHDESRRLYDTEAFSAEREDGPEPRTAHLGVDLFAPAGTPVHAPLAGAVASVQRNPAPLDYGPTLILEHEGEDGAPFWTLYGHLDGELLGRLAVGERVEAGAEVARLGDVHENGGWPPHLHFQVILDRLGTRGDFPGVSTPSERRVWAALSPDPAPLLGLDSCAANEPSVTDLLAERRARFCSSMSISYREPLAIVKGRGTTLFDSSGRAFLDAVNNVPHVGHCHPRVVAAGQRQMALLNTNTRYLADGLHRYAAKLRAKLPEHLEVLYFVSSGSEANEVALRLARAATGGATERLVQEYGYHGHTNATVSSSHYKFAGRGGFERPGDVHVVPVPDPIRGQHRGPDSGPAYVAEVERTLESLLASGRRPCAMLAEAIIGCGGQVVPPAGYLAGAFEAVRRAGGVAIADEVQVGFGRVGTHFWAFEEQGAAPDIVTMGKPIGNGHPMAAVATTRAIAEAFAGGMEFFATFGGNNVSAAIGEAVLDVIEDEGLMENAHAVGSLFFEAMRPVQERHAVVADVRGRGLYLGVELVEPRDGETPSGRAAAHVANRMRDRGVLISTDGPHANVLKIKPPIVFSGNEMQRLVATLDEVLGETAIADLAEPMKTPLQTA